MKKLVFTFGRMNPPTIGHEKLANKIKEVARKENANPRIYLSHTQNPKKDPLSYNDKYRFATKAFGIVKRSQSKQIFQILPEIEKEGFTDIIMVVGSDRIKEFDRVLQKYNGKDYNFNSIKTVSSGDRDPDAQGVEGMSGSKLRGVAMSGDEKTFKSGLASKLSDADKTKIYNIVRKNLKEAIMNDWTEEDDLILEEAMQEVDFTEEELEMLAELGEYYEMNEVLNFMQRIKKSRVMKRLGKKLARLRKIASKKMKGGKKLMQMARKAAIKVLRKKLVGKDKAAKYSVLSMADKKQIDMKVKKNSARIAPLARKLLPQVRKDVMQRVKQARQTPQNNEYIPEGAGKYSAMNLKKAKELMSPAKNREDGIKRIMKGMKVSYKQAIRFHDDVMKSHGFKSEAMVPVGKMTGKGFEPAKKDKDTKLPPHLKDLKTIRKAFSKSKKVKEDLDEAKSSTGYKLYHKSFSDAMQHAYAHAKSKFGITVKKDEIDNKVATGPKKPGTGKTNTYRLKGDKGNIQVQVANLDGKKYELNMYKEEYSFGNWLEGKNFAQQAAIAIAKKKSGKYNKDGERTAPYAKEEKEAPKKIAQDPDVKDVEGTQPKKYYKGLSKDTKDARANHFKNRDTSKNDNRPAPGDADAKTKPSKHTLKFKRMYGEDGPCWDTHKQVGMKKKGDKMVPNCVPKNEDAETRVQSRIKARQSANDKRDRIALAKAKARDTVRDIRSEDVSEISTQKINRYYDKAKQSHDRAGNSAFARHLRKEPGIEKDLDTMRRRKAGIKTARSIAIKKLRGEKPGKLREANYDYSWDMTEDAKTGLKAKSEKSGIPLGILRQVYNRGMAAWRGGHRPGASQQQWAFARVNSFITKGSGTWGKADKDLAAKARASMKSKKESVNETGGAGEFGTKALLARYQKDTPGQQLQSAYNVDDDFGGKLKKKFKDLRKKDGFDSVKEENMEEKLTRGQQSKLDDLETYLGHLQRVSMTPSRRAEIEATKKKIKKLKSEETGEIEEMTGINVPELIKTTIHRLTHPKGYADIMKDYIKRVKEPHKGTNGSVLADIARERGFDRVKPIQDYINRLINKGKLPKALMAQYESTVKEEVEIDEDGCPIDLFDHVLEEAEYQGKKVTLNDPVRSSDGNKKFHVYVKNEKGNVIKLGFGDPNMEIKRDDPARRKSFRARHNCDNPGPKYKARYWSCYQWRGGSKVDN
tara:strand:+ start:5473 stop:9078 length:3606 start_codon:yes stop_codon:yes gene_type:complete